MLPSRRQDEPSGYSAEDETTVRYWRHIRPTESVDCEITKRCSSKCGSRSGYRGTRTTWVARMASLDGDSDGGEMGDQCLLVGIRAV